MGGNNVSPTAAVASAHHHIYVATNAIDENCSTYWYEDSECPEWIYFDCGADREITEVHIAWVISGADFGSDDFDIEGSNNTVDWIPLVDGLDDSGKGAALGTCSYSDHVLPANSVYRYIRIYCNSGNNSYDQVAMIEFLFDWTEPSVATPVMMHHYNTINKIIRG